MLQSGPVLEANSRVVFIYRAVTHVSNLCWFHFSALWVFSVGTRIKVWTPDHLTWLAALQITLILIKAQTRLSASEPRADGSAARFGLFALVLPASRYAQRSLWAARWPVGSHYCHHQRKSSCQIPSKPKGVRKMSVFFAPPLSPRELSSVDLVLVRYVANRTGRERPWWHVVTGSLMKLFL